MCGGREISMPSSQFCCEPRTALKNKDYDDMENIPSERFPAEKTKHCKMPSI